MSSDTTKVLVDRDELLQIIALAEKAVARGLGCGQEIGHDEIDQWREDQIAMLNRLYWETLAGEESA